MLEEINPKAALASARRAVELNPALPEAYNQLGGVLWDAGKKDEALAAWEKVAEVDPYNASGLANGAVMLSVAGDLTRAQEVLDEALCPEE